MLPNCSTYLLCHAGLVGADRARRGDTSKLPAGYVAPETAGLPVDDTFNYLALMKRCAALLDFVAFVELHPFICWSPPLAA